MELEEIEERLRALGYTLKRQSDLAGFVVDLPDSPGLVAEVACDNPKIFQFLLGFSIPGRGELVTASIVFWSKWLKNSWIDISDHVIASGGDIERFAPKLADDGELLRRTIIARKTQSAHWESVKFGSPTIVFSAHAHDSQARRDPLGLVDDDGSLSLKLFYAMQRYAKVELPAKSRTKLGLNLEECTFRYGRTFAGNERGLQVLVNRLGPNNVRFRWPVKSDVPGSFLNQEYLREWGESQGLHQCDPEDQENWTHAFSLKAPSPVTLIQEAGAALHAFSVLAQSDLKSFQQDVMGIS